jgi:LysM repeat protein
LEKTGFKPVRGFRGRPRAGPIERDDLSGRRDRCVAGSNGGMDSEKEDRRTGPGWQEDPVETLELLLSWILAAGVVVLFLLVAGVLAVQEQGLVAEVHPAIIVTSPSALATPTVAQTVQTPTPEQTKLPSAASPSPASSGSACDIPPGWVEYRIKWGDSLSGLASEHGLSVKALKEANCLERNTIFAGSTLWVPSGTGEAGTGAATVASPRSTPTVAESRTELATPGTGAVELTTPTRVPPMATSTPGS